MSGEAAEVHRVVLVEIAFDDTFARVDRRTALRVDDGNLPAVAARILVGDALDDVRRGQALLEQRNGLRAVLTVCRRLCRNGPDTGLDIRHGRPRTKRARLHPDAEFLGRGIERDDRKGRKPRIRSRRLLWNGLAGLRETRRGGEKDEQNNPAHESP
jgi:hypothetical protein